MSGATTVRLPATRVRAGDSLACFFAGFAIALFVRVAPVRLRFFASASAVGSSCSESGSPSELLGCPSAVCVSESSASSSSACGEQRVEARGRQPKATRRHCDAGPYVVGGLGWSVAHRSGAGEERRGEGDAHRWVW